MSRLRNASPSTRRGFIHADCFGSWAMASPRRMRSIVIRFASVDVGPRRRLNIQCRGLSAIHFAQMKLKYIQLSIHIYVYVSDTGHTTSEVTQPIGGDRARSSLGTSHPPSIKIHETSATRRSWLVLPHAQYELNTNIVAASLKK